MLLDVFYFVDVCFPHSGCPLVEKPDCRVMFLKGVGVELQDFPERHKALKHMWEEDYEESHLKLDVEWDVGGESGPQTLTYQALTTVSGRMAALSFSRTDGKVLA